MEDPLALARLRECCDRMGIPRSPRLVETAAVSTPAVDGLICSRVLLPPGFCANLSGEEQRFVFLHELAHLRRHDLWLNWAFVTLQILHWFNPLVWFAFARWRRDREVACDAAALEAAGPDSPRRYGETMLRLLTNFEPAYRPSGLIGVLEDRRQLHHRMRMIASYRPAPRHPAAAVGLLAILALVGLTDAQVAISSAPDPFPASVTTSSPLATDAAIAKEIANRFAGDRTRFLNYLRSRGLTLREYRREVEESLRAAAALPVPAAPYVLFLVNSAETMLSEASRVGSPSENRERGQPYARPSATATDEQKRATPKWQRTLAALEQMLRALPAETNFHVAHFSDVLLTSIGGRASPADTNAITDTMSRIHAVVPHGGSNLESAFRIVGERFTSPAPTRIVLITDGLPTTSDASPIEGLVSEADRIKAFNAAARRLVPRIPLHAVLMPAAIADPAAAGLFWELAHASGGQLTAPGRTPSEARTHLAFVVDTSGSMRDPNHGGLWPIVISTIEATLDTQPQLIGLQLIDGDGRFILGRRGTGADAWLPNTPQTRESIRRVLGRYSQDTVSNPVPGIYNAMRFLHDQTADVRMGIYILGDEFNSSDNAGVVLDRIDALNLRDANGRRAVTISGIGFPTTLRAGAPMGNTGLRFANLMRLLTMEHDGSFIALPKL